MKHLAILLLAIISGARKQFNNLLIGCNGSGKTQFMIELAIQYLENNPEKRVLFVLSDDGEDKLKDIEEIPTQDIDALLNFVGVKKYIVDDAADFEFIAEVYKPFKDAYGRRVQRRFNGLMCCDDLGGAMNRRPKDILNFFKKRRQPNIDFLWAFHGLRADVPPAFYTYINYIYLFQTSDTHEDILKNLPMHRRQSFLEKYMKVQKMAETNPHAKVEILINPITI